MQWDRHKKGFFAQILFSFEFGGTQPSPSGAFGKEFANGYWEIMWEIQPAGHKLRGRRAARNTGINKRQKIFSKILRDFRILGALRVHFCPNEISPRGHKQLQKNKIKGIFPVCILQQAQFHSQHTLNSFSLVHF